MRPIIAIRNDIEVARSESGSESLARLADELHRESIPEARAEALFVNGLLHLRTGMYSAGASAGREAAECFSTLNDDLGYAKSLHLVGVSLLKLSEFSEALDSLQKAAAVFTAYGSERELARTLCSIGAVQLAQCKYQRALSTFQQSLDIGAAIADRKLSSLIISKIGEAHLSSGDPARALESYQRSLDINTDTNNQRGLVISYDGLGRVYRLIGNFPQSLESYYTALEHAHAIGDKRSTATILDGIGSTLSDIGDHHQALEKFNQALDAFTEIGQVARTATVIHHISLVNYRMQNFEEAYENACRARSITQSIGGNANVAIYTGTIVSSLIAMDRNDEATAELRNQGTMEMVSRTSCVEHLINRAELARRNELVEMAQQDLVDALPIAKAHGLPMIESDVHRALCDLAQQRGDFALYINHSNEQRRINDEIHGRQAIQRLATLEVERKAEAERRDREKERQLLYGALPQNVVERLVRGEKVTGDHFADASVLIADVVGFTSHSADMHPNDVVLLLEQLFAELDSVCDEYSITKVKTIGDAYLCFKGDRDAYTNANAVVTMAKKVVQMSFSWPNGDPIILRIGIHSGPITAGVIGSLRLQYDVWGDTVNMTSRLESTAEAGKIHVSHDLVSCFTLDVKHNNQESVPSPLHSFSPRGHVALKGKGVVATYWVDA